MLWGSLSIWLADLVQKIANIFKIFIIIILITLNSDALHKMKKRDGMCKVVHV